MMLTQVAFTLLRPHSRWSLLAPATVVLVLALLCSPSRAAPPDILLIVADDLGYGDIGCYGAPDVRTPVLDKLAREGCRLTSFYSNGPECTPTRTALMTGRYQQRVGGLECAIGTHNVGRYDDAIRLAAENRLGLPADQNELLRGLRSAGYSCGLFGKWHLGYEPHFYPHVHGFDVSFGVLGGNADYFRHTEDDGWPVLFENEHLVKRTGYLTRLFTDAAIEWIEASRDQSRPLFVYMPYTCPHTPIQPPGSDTGELIPREKWNSGSRKDLAAMIEFMDAEIGRLLESLATARQGRDRLVIFMSDNGGTQIGRNSPYSGRKGTTFEGGIRVPCIVHWPGHVPSGRVDSNPAMTMDITRSLLRIAGSEVPAGQPFDGVDVIARLERDQPASQRPLFWRGRRGMRTWKAVRRGDWKLIVRVDNDESQEFLFNLASDPRETTDLSESRSDQAEQLRQLLANWERDVAPQR